MNFDVMVNGRPWRVSVDPTEQAGRVQVSLKGRRRVFDAAWVDAQTLSLVEVDRSPARVQDVAFQPSEGGELRVTIAGRTFQARATAEGKPPERRSDSAGAAIEGPQNVVAPMPGRIVRVLVNPGDRVASEQGVVVVEAMKMENELRSPKDGVVRDVRVKQGQAVEARTVLMVIE